MKNLNFTLGTIIFFLFSFVIIGRANFADTYGFSASGMARGNAMTAIAHDWSSVYYNMAGLGKTVKYRKIKEKKKYESDFEDDFYSDLEEEKNDNNGLIFYDQFAFFCFYSYPFFEIDIPRSDVKGDEDLDLRVGVIGLVLDLNHFYKMPDFISSARFGLGAGLVQDDFSLYMARINSVDLRTHNFVRYGREAARMVILSGVGFGLFDDMFGVGLGANVFGGGDGSVLVDSVEVGPEKQSPEIQSKLDIKPKIAPALGLYFSPGKVNSKLSPLEWGVSYRGELFLEVEPVDVGAIVEAANLDMEINFYIFGFYTPHTFSTGISYDLQLLQVSFDVEYQMWSKYKASNAREEFYTVNNIGSIQEYRDIFIPKVGGSLKVLDWLTLVGGYYYQPSIVKDSSLEGVFNQLDNDKHVLSGGMEIIVPKKFGMMNPVNLNLGLQYQYLVPKDVTKKTNSSEEEAALNPNYSFGGNCLTATCEVILPF